MNRHVAGLLYGLCVGMATVGLGGLVIGSWTEGAWTLIFISIMVAAFVRSEEQDEQ